MHVAICTLLTPAGYYEFSHRDEQNWPHFNLLQPLPSLEEKEQKHLLKEAIIDYFWKKNTFLRKCCLPRLRPDVFDDWIRSGKTGAFDGNAQCVYLSISRNIFLTA